MKKSSKLSESLLVAALCVAMTSSIVWCASGDLDPSFGNGGKLLLPDGKWWLALPLSLVERVPSGRYDGKESSERGVNRENRFAKALIAKSCTGQLRRVQFCQRVHYERNRGH
jgi:hypothetical protein